jgi:TfoX/Sxy family transcriptional regulator of competence genes
MASDQSFMDYVAEQLRHIPRFSYRKMFGEYAAYSGDKVIALICDNQVFVRPTEGGRVVLGKPRLGPPYPGAKLHFLIEGELEDAELMARLVAATAAEVKPARSKAKAKPAAKAAKPKAKAKAKKSKPAKKK